MSRIVVTKPVEHGFLGLSLLFLVYVVAVGVAAGPSCEIWRVVADYGFEDLVSDVHHVAMVFELEVPAVTSVHRKPSEEMLFVSSAAEAGTA